jgi:hypothetical protein
MTTTTFPSQVSLEPTGRGVDVMTELRRVPVSQPTVARAKPAKSLFRRAWDSIIASREQAALAALAREDSRIAAEIRAARDRAEAQA